jgi:hypothetical protein
MPQSRRRDHDGSTRRRWSGSTPGHLVSTLKRKMSRSRSGCQFSTGVHRNPQRDQPPQTPSLDICDDDYIKDRS